MSPFPSDVTYFSFSSFSFDSLKHTTHATATLSPSSFSPLSVTNFLLYFWWGEADFEFDNRSWRVCADAPMLLARSLLMVIWQWS